MAIDINERKVIEGNREHLDFMNLAVLKHPEALAIYDEMRANVWTHNEVDVSKDKTCYMGYGDNGLLPSEQVFYNRNLARLSNLDGIQVGNLALSIAPHITSPEFSMAIVEQASQECVHVRTYTKMIDAFAIDPNSIHSMYMTDELLQKNNDFILQMSKIVRNDYSPQNFMFTIVYNIVLEWLYFNNGFLNFYVLGRRNKMRMSIKNIRLIHRDERIHGKLFVYMWQCLHREFPELFKKDAREQALEIIRIATEHEKLWGRHLIGDGILGLTPQISDSFLDVRSNECSVPLGLGEANPGARTEIDWFEKFSKIGLKQNFFESKSDNYQVGTFAKESDDHVPLIDQSMLRNLIQLRIPGAPA